MSTSANTELLKFFKWWLQEAERETPSWVVTSFGLCWNAEAFGVPADFRNNLFKSHPELDVTYPFGGAVVFHNDSLNDEMHLNPERIAFVKSQIERLEKLNETI